MRRNYMHQENCNLKADKPRENQNVLNNLEYAKMKRKMPNIEIHLVEEGNKNCMFYFRCKP